jgi:hypothetical protein
VILAPDDLTAALAQLQWFFDGFESLAAVEKGEFPLTRELDSPVIGDARSLALSTEDTGIREVDHDPDRTARRIQPVFMANCPGGTNLFAGKAAETVSGIELGLSPKTGVGDVGFDRKG